MKLPPVRGPLAAAVAAVAGFVLVALFLVGVGVWSGLPEANRAALERALVGQALWLVVGILLLVGGLAVIMLRLYSRYVAPLRRMAADARLMASTNRAHRIAPPDPPELAELAKAVNALADRTQANEEDVARRVAAAQAELAAERNRLAALMAELTIPVLVCTVDGRILLYNEAARELLGQTSVGLGRSVFGVVDREAFTHLLDRVGAASPSAVTTTVHDRLLRIHLQPIAGSDDGTDLGGVVLTMDDLTRQAAATDRRDALLRTLAEQTRGAVANIRAAVETILDYPDMDAEGQQRFAGIIQEEAQRLSATVTEATPRSEDVTDPMLEEVLGSDLLTAIERRLTGSGVPVSAPASAAADTDELWLSVDSFGVIRTASELVRWLVDKHGVPEAQLRIAPADQAAQRYASLDVRWRGTPLDAGALRDWTEQPNVREWLRRRGYEMWCGHDDGTAFVRLLLPRAAEAPTLPDRDQRVRPHRPEPAERPHYYDFDLFRLIGDEQASAEWDARRLADLAYTVFDTETTGLAPEEGDEIISIGAVRVVNGRVLRTETFERLVDPRRRIPAVSYAIHGISGEMVRGQPVIEDVLPEFARFAADTVLVGHEVGFDMSFIARKEHSAGVHFSQPVLDTRALSLILHPEHERHSLEAIAQRLGVSVVGRHTALGDALVTAEVFVRQLELLQERGLHTLGDVRVAAPAPLVGGP